MLLNPTWGLGIGFILVDLDHLLILPGYETSVNIIVEDGDLASPLLSQTDADDPRTQPLRQTSLLGRMKKCWIGSQKTILPPCKLLNTFKLCTSLLSGSFVFYSGPDPHLCLTIYPY